MRYAAGHKAMTRDRILCAAERAFSAEGYAGVGVDALAEQAGITSGAFYGHFKGKAELFREAAVAGLTRLRQGIEAFREREGAGWIAPFIRHYLAPPFRQGLEGGCALPSLSGEVARSTPETRTAYEAAMRAVHASLSGSLPGPGRLPPDQRAWAMLAMLAGAANMARAAESEATGQEIAAAVTAALNLLSGEPAA